VNAQLCTASLKLSVPTLLDKVDNSVNRTYAGWPDRMYIVDQTGHIAYMGKPGPWGFKPAEVEGWLRNHVAD
jgi:hypothetical protein